jgi:xanthine dehydrogenase accessory factor
LHTLRRGLDAGVPYVGLVASHKRGAGVLDELRADGVSEEHLQLIDVPAGLDIGARAPAEIALSILAKIVAVRRGKAFTSEASTDLPAPGRTPSPAPAQIAIDPICGMTVAAIASTPSVDHDGETVYFCCEGCKTKFVEQTAAA